MAGMSQMVMNDFKHACAMSICLAFFLLVIFIDWDPIFHGRLFSMSSLREEPLPDWSQEAHIESPSVRKLIDDIQAATMVASEGVYHEMTLAETEEWRRRNPCRSRSELLPMYDQRQHVRKLARNYLFDQVLDEYSKLHRTCMSKVGTNLTEFFLHNMTVPGCKFVVGNPMYGTGLGNKMIVTASALLYAIVTQRVLLVPFRTNLPTFMCEPFVGSSWVLDSSTFTMPDGKRGNLPWEKPEVPKSREWMEDLDFLQAMDEWLAVQELQQLHKDDEGEKNQRNLSDHSNHESPPSLAYAMSVTIKWQPVNRFYCPTEQRMVAEVPWLYWGGCIYSVPKIFTSPVFRATLGSLFPDKMVITRLLRSVLLPGDVVLDKVTQLNDQFFAKVDRRVGIQLRSLHGKSSYEKEMHVINRRILDCAVQNGILHNFRNDSSASYADHSLPPTTFTKVFIASLYNDLHAFLKEFYNPNRSVSGEVVEVIQVSSNEEQQLGIEEDIQAYVEILLLSLSDQLLVTPSSTFGAIAQAYGAITPWFIETREKTETSAFMPCQRAQSIDICHQFSDANYDCPHDPAIDGVAVFDKVPALRECLDIDHSSGIQLVSTFLSDFD